MYHACVFFLSSVILSLFLTLLQMGGPFRYSPIALSVLRMYCLRHVFFSLLSCTTKQMATTKRKDRDKESTRSKENRWSFPERHLDDALAIQNRSSYYTPPIPIKDTRNAWPIIYTSPSKRFGLPFARTWQVIFLFQHTFSARINRWHSFNRLIALSSKNRLPASSITRKNKGPPFFCVTLSGLTRSGVGDGISLASLVPARQLPLQQSFDKGAKCQLSKVVSGALRTHVIKHRPDIVKELQSTPQDLIAQKLKSRRNRRNVRDKLTAPWNVHRNFWSFLLITHRRCRFFVYLFFFDL